MNVDANVKLCVKIIVVKVVISVPLTWSRTSLKLVVTLGGELYGSQYVLQLQSFCHTNSPNFILSFSLSHSPHLVFDNMRHRHASS